MEKVTHDQKRRYSHDYAFAFHRDRNRFIKKGEQKMSNTTMQITIEEYTRLKDIETRFTIMKDQMLHAEYIPIYQQIILGIENEYMQAHKELKVDMLPQK